MKHDVDLHIVALGKERGINLLAGWVRPSDGRFMVYHAEAYPACHRSGTALRSRLVWWLATGEVIEGGTFDIHHKNHVRSDDHLANLDKVEHRAHAHLHNPKQVGVPLVCHGCGRTYHLPAWRITQRKKEGRPTRFCSLNCRSLVPRSLESRQRQSDSLKRAYAEGRR